MKSNEPINILAIFSEASATVGPCRCSVLRIVTLDSDTLESIIWALVNSYALRLLLAILSGAFPLRVSIGFGRTQSRQFGSTPLSPPKPSCICRNETMQCFATMSPPFR